MPAIVAMPRCDHDGRIAARHPSRAADRRSAATAWPRSCWQYLNARSPYFHDSRQWIEVSATRKRVASARRSPAPARRRRQTRSAARGHAGPARSARPRRAALPVPPASRSRERRAGDQVGLGGMQVAARRIDAQRPARIAEHLPRRQPQGVAQEVADGVAADRTRGEWRGREQPVVADRADGRLARCAQRRASQRRRTVERLGTAAAARPNRDSRARARSD